MAGTELFGDEERKEVMDVLETGIIFRYNHDAERKGIWKARTFEKEFAHYLGAKHATSAPAGRRLMRYRLPLAESVTARGDRPSLLFYRPYRIGASCGGCTRLCRDRRNAMPQP